MVRVTLRMGNECVEVYFEQRYDTKKAVHCLNKAFFLSSLSNREARVLERGRVSLTTQSRATGDSSRKRAHAFFSPLPTEFRHAHPPSRDRSSETKHIDALLPVSRRRSRSVSQSILDLDPLSPQEICLTLQRMRRAARRDHPRR